MTATGKAVSAVAVLDASILVVFSLIAASIEPGMWRDFTLVGVGVFAMDLVYAIRFIFGWRSLW